MKNTAVDSSLEVFQGCYPLRMEPLPVEGYEPKDKPEGLVCNGMRLLSEGRIESGRNDLELAWSIGSLWAGELLSYGYTANWFGENNYQIALHILHRMIRQNYPMAMKNLGFLYLAGIGVRRSDRWAKYWFEKGTAHGCVNSMLNLATMLSIGPKRYRDYRRALELLNLAMDKDDPEAFNMMGLCYHEGRGVEQDDIKAFKYYKIGYDKGAGPAATYNLGRCYYFGRGVRKNTKKADLFFKEAEDRGFPVEYEMNKK